MTEDIFRIARFVADADFKDLEFTRIEKVKVDILNLFSGRFKGYQRCDSHYHDIEHTVQVITPFTQIIDGWNKSGRKPRVTSMFFELGLIAVLLHDTGYIKRVGDNDGTGGKYTFVHIERSIEFARQYLSGGPFTKEEVSAVANMIQCTGMIDRLMVIDFQSEEAKVCGYALGTADLIGQMSAKDYPEKLHDLYMEFKEAYDYEGPEGLREKGVCVFESAEALLRKTEVFYENVVRERIKDMGSLDEYIKYHSPDRKDSYNEAIRENLRRIRSTVGD